MRLRGQMPLVAAFIDEMRAAFGTDVVNEWMRGQDGAWICASENGVRWCTPGRVCGECKGKRSGK